MWNYMCERKWKDGVSTALSQLPKLKEQNWTFGKTDGWRRLESDLDALPCHLPRSMLLEIFRLIDSGCMAGITDLKLTC